MGKIWRVSGPLVIADDMMGSEVYEIVQIGKEGIVGEVIGLGLRVNLGIGNNRLAHRLPDTIDILERDPYLLIPWYVYASNTRHPSLPP